MKGNFTRQTAEAKIEKEMQTKKNTRKQKLRRDLLL
jgi:hypothetical protein